MAIRDPYLNEDDVPRGWSDRPTVPELRSAAQATLST